MPPAEQSSSAHGDAKNNGRRRSSKRKPEAGAQNGGQGADKRDGAHRRKKAPKPGVGERRRSLLEYDIGQMYPEMEVLVEKKRSEWNYLDERVIRALWLETRTNVLDGWKQRTAKFGARGKKRPVVEPRLNHVAELRLEYRAQQLERKQADDRRNERLRVGNDRPHFGPVTMATNTAAVMRHQFNRNDPPVPSRYLQHYDRFRRPPFNVFAVKRCYPITHAP